jgi:hypothetical protein
MEQFIVMKTSVENVMDACESQEDSRKKFVDRIIKTNCVVPNVWTLYIPAHKLHSL